MKKDKILLLGATGMAGHIVSLYFQSIEKYEIISVVFRNRITENCIVVDVRDKEEVSKLIKDNNPTIIINCIGILIKGSRKYPDDAIYINSYLPHLLSRLAEEVGAKLIHLSTDCVFSGEKGGYSESDFRDANDIYGRSKSLGEVFSNKHLTLRTSIIGPELKSEGEGLFHWFMKQNGIINGFSEVFWGGITTLELAKAIEKSIDNNLTGLLHVTNGEKISKHALLILLKKIWNNDSIDINPFEGKKIDKSLNMSSRFDFRTPSYEKMLFDLKNWMDLYENIYKKIY